MLELPPIILADWDEEQGPLIIDSLFPDNGSEVIDDSPEVLVTRCYITAQSIFARTEFEKINFNIPFVSIKKMAMIYFDVIADESVRGGKRPFILIIFAPINIGYRDMETISKVVEPYIEQYKHDTIPNLADLQQELRNILSIESTTAGQEVSPITTRESVSSMQEAGTNALNALPAESPDDQGSLPTRLKIRVVKKTSKSSGDRNHVLSPDLPKFDKRVFHMRVGPWSEEETKRLIELKNRGLDPRKIA
ncbi:MAG: hypothetical protein ACTSRA_12720, partial [Promethearchaeota archaeon]